MALATAPAGLQAERGKLSRAKTQVAAFSGGLDALGSVTWVEGCTDAYKGSGIRACSLNGYGLLRTASTKPLTFKLFLI